MRILFAGVEPFIPDSYSEANQTVFGLSQQLALMGHEPVVLSGMRSGKDQQTIRDNSFNFPIYRSGKPMLSFAALLTTILPDIVVLTGQMKAGLLEMLSEMELPVVVWLFDNEQNDLAECVFNSEIQFLASSSFVADFTRKFLGVKAPVIPPFISEQGEVRSSPGDRVLFFNPVRIKGVELVFEIARQRPLLRFTFVETECLSDKWRQYCYKKAALCGNIDWHRAGVNSNAYYKQARLLLVPSLEEEGFSRVVTEAQRYGTPVLASNRGYLPTNVGAGGSIINLQEPLDVWLEAVDRLMENKTSNTERLSFVHEHVFHRELETDRVAKQFIGILKSHIEKAALKTSMLMQ